jgi:hypothetical protein
MAVWDSLSQSLGSDGENPEIQRMVGPLFESYEHKVLPAMFANKDPRRRYVYPDRCFYGIRRDFRGSDEYRNMARRWFSTGIGFVFRYRDDHQEMHQFDLFRGNGYPWFMMIYSAFSPGMANHSIQETEPFEFVLDYIRPQARSDGFDISSKVKGISAGTVRQFTDRFSLELLAGNSSLTSYSMASAPYMAGKDISELLIPKIFFESY